MTVLWQPGFSKDGSVLCMCVCTRVRVCVLHGTCSSYSVTNSLPNERQRISYFPLNFSGACSCSDQQTVTETMLCDFCGHSLFVTLSVAPSLSVFPLSLSFHFPRSFPSSLSACLFLAFSLPLSLCLSFSLTLSLLPSSWSACPHKPIVTTVRSSGHMKRSPACVSVEFIKHHWTRE